ncbi:hypothetical protein LC087_00800 [Bacillus carboniphilus]|uniref:Uncharacterized protein n=1 Tax=Bacillus carboniphilus TaxID=86663 RepID=A0ABY9JYZ7_9BACI|nr:hypothetical protein [Bacillus carboniphilus]WLR42815.1 hypothetical protein LC087_00800 [Bacillus carboniphilus]
MLKQCQEEDFYQLKSVARSRLNPIRASSFLWVVSFFSGVMTSVIAFAVYGADYPISNFWNNFANISIIVLALQFSIALFYSKQTISFRFQNTQSIFVSLFAIKMSLDMYLAITVFSQNDFIPNYFIPTAIVLCIGGLILMVISTIRGIKRVQQGQFRQGGKGLYNLSESKTYVSLPIIFGVTMMGGAIARTLSDSASLLAQSASVYFTLLLAVILQYTIAFAIPEFFLVTYGKFRFESFYVPMPKPELKDTPREVIMAKNPAQRGKASKKGNQKKAKKKKK